MIPKIIHYCWFGRNPLPPLAEKCIASWREFLPDYEIKEWNEDNFDVNINPYTAEAYKAKKYAFVSDYARFWILYQYGGLYFDTDVEIIKSIDDIVERGPFMGCERYADNSGSKGATTLGVAPGLGLGANPGLGLGANPGLGLGANPGLGLYKKFLERYDTLDFKQEREKNKTIVHYTTELLVSEGLSNTSDIQYVGGIYVYPKEYFCPINQTTHRINITDNTRSIHHYAATWTDKTQMGGVKRFLQPFIPEALLLMWHNFKMSRKQKKRFPR